MSYRVLQLIKTYKSNAPLLNSMANLPSEDFTTITCYLTGSDDGKNEMYSNASEVIYCQLRKRKVYWSNWQTVKRLADLIDEKQIDLVVCQFRRTIPIGVVAALISKRKPKTAGVLHGIVGGRNSLSRQLLNWFAYRKLDALISISESGRSAIVKNNIGLREDAIVAVPNGVDVDRYQARANQRGDELPTMPQDAVRLLMVGRLAPVKNHVRVLHAFAEIVKDNSGAQLLIAGKGPLQQQLERIIEEDGIPNVHLLGHRSDIPVLLSQVDAFLMPSVREGLPMALMEAMLAGLPVLTSNSAGMLELVPTEEFGYLVDPNSTSSIINGLKELLSSGVEERKKRALAAQQRVLADYTSSVMAQKYESIFRQMLAV
ncbi:glycosyltransferase family 4 protein [Aurantivibrio plasticivorans]